MNTHAGYSKRTITDTNVLLAGGGDKSLADFIGGIQYVSASHKILIKTATVNASWTDLVTLITTDENVKQTPKTDNTNRPLMMINGGTSTGTLTSTSMFSIGIYANASTNMITAGGFIKASSDDTYILLGGGGHKAIDDFATSTHNHDDRYYTETESDNKYLTIATALTVTGAKTFNSGKWILKGPEYDNILNKGDYIKLYTYNDSTQVSYASITNSISFNWYNDEWRIGLIRSGDTATDGFVIALMNNDDTHALDRFRISKSGVGYINGNMIYHTGNLPAYPTQQSLGGPFLPLAGGTMDKKSLIHAATCGTDIQDGAIRIREYDYAGATNNNNFSTHPENAPKILFYWSGNNSVSLGSNGSQFYRMYSTSAIYKIWDEGNDGSTSGLDADLLDGKHASEFSLAHSHPYLPLTGGTLSLGAITSFKIKKTSNTACFINFTGWKSDDTSVSDYNTDTNYGYLGMRGINNPTFKNASGTNYALLHAGNYSLYALPISGGTLTGALQIKLNASATNYKLRFNSDNEGGNITIYAPDNYTMTKSTSTIRFYQIDAFDGNLRIYTETDGSVNLRFKNNGDLLITGNSYAVNFYTTSDRNKKTNISSFSEHIRKFQLKDTEKWHYGVIAQEVPEIFRDGEEGNMTVNYNSVLSFYIGLLENKVKILEERIRILESK